MPLLKKLKKPKDKNLPPLPDPEPAKQLDGRVGLDTYRDFFTIKNYWKSVDRKRATASVYLLHRYLNQNPGNKSKYPKLKNVDAETVDSALSDPGFEAVAAAYLKVFDDVITAVEEKPGDVTDACHRLSSIGKMHRSKVAGMEGTQFQAMEEPFLHMVSEVLQDRYNEKAENLFRKFFQFCLKYLLEGFNS